MNCYYGTLREKGTWLLWWVINNKFHNIFIHLSTEDPWLLPRFEDTNERQMFGWLFIYFGRFKVSLRPWEI